MKGSNASGGRKGGGREKNTEQCLSLARVLFVKGPFCPDVLFIYILAANDNYLATISSESDNLVAKRLPTQILDWGKDKK